MYEVLADIVDAIRTQGSLDALELGRILNAHNKRVGGAQRAYSKKRMLPYYLKLKEEDPDAWAALDIDEELERQLFTTLRMKPRRTASGVATITVITKPHACSGHCLYCPNDVRMPKSYLHREPACQRAERNYFDPYLQVASRLRALTQMGHACDKIELIILGGSWTDYPESYQTWFMAELFRALNEAPDSSEELKARRDRYREAGIDGRDEVLEAQTCEVQTAVNEGTIDYNDAIAKLYGAKSAWGRVAAWQAASFDELFAQQRINERAVHRVVGLVVETRPETLDAPTLARLRALGCTKVQIGVQSLRPEVLALNNRPVDEMALRRAFELLRVFGFKIHTHFMVNLYGSSIVDDEADYVRFVNDAAFQPDEVKLYPCVLVEGTGLVEKHGSSQWQPYAEDELVELLARDVLATPAFTRVSRMIRDISAVDIVAGSKKTNLRQMVEASDVLRDAAVREIRFREIAGDEVELDELALEEVAYETTNTSERFLQWVTPRGKIAGFLRLSLPHAEYVSARAGELPDELGCAMIREVHVYGQVANLHRADGSAQHLGLGRQLVEHACVIAREAGFGRINVISSVGTRDYYRRLGFGDGSLYQTREL
ncbi:MAG: tRNA uridine(34) 5-carboxymethylaminomethyl modification radical SAM/GNAT enzyme Elp3 [Coriobacteriales bacterium]